MKGNLDEVKKALLFDLIRFCQEKTFDETASKLIVKIAEFGNERFTLPSNT